MKFVVKKIANNNGSSASSYHDINYGETETNESDFTYNKIITLNKLLTMG